MTSRHMMSATSAQRWLRLVVAALLLLGLAAGVRGSAPAVAATPTLSLSPTQNGPNGTETATGSGFTPNSQVDITIVNSVTPAGASLGSIATDANGSFSGSFVLPLALDAGPALNTITATDHATSAVKATAQLSGAPVAPTIQTISPGTITAGSAFSVIEGVGFGGSGPLALHHPDVLSLYLGDVLLVTTTTGASSGFQVFNVPVPANAPSGNVLLTVRGIVTGAGQNDVATKIVAVPGPANLTVVPNPGQPGTQLAVSAAGFAANEAVNVTATYADPAAPGGSTTTRTPTTSDGAGHIGPISVTVSATAPRTGQVSIIARGATSDRAASDVVSLLGARSLLLDPTTGAAGSTVTVSGFGFVPNQIVTVLGLRTTAVARADATGAFTATLQAPITLRGGVYSVQAQDRSGSTATAPFVVTAAPKATVGLQPATAAPGATVVVTGAGYTAGEAITFTLGASAPDAPSPSSSALTTRPANIVASATGTFSATLVVPTLDVSAGYLLTAHGGQSLATGQATLRVVLPPASQWYFAEGFTGQGPTIFFTETLRLLNTTTRTAFGSILYMLPGGGTTRVALTVPSQALIERSVNADVGPNKAVAALVTLDQKVAVSRIIRRTDASGALLDASSSSGQPAPSRVWQFAEGYTGASFQEYLTVQNPAISTAAVTITLLPRAGTSPVTVTASLAPLSRYTLNVRSALPNRSLSAVVRASVPVVAERVLYWGDGSGSAKFGADTKPGVPTAGRSYQFAYTSVASGDQPFLTVLNPAGLTAPAAASVTILAAYSDATGRVVGQVSQAVASGQRITVTPPATVSTTLALATTLTASGPVVAEQAQYVGGSPNVGSHAGFALLGRTPAMAWQFANGDTSGSPVSVTGPITFSGALPSSPLTSTTPLTQTTPVSGTAPSPGSGLALASSMRETVYLYNPGNQATNVVGTYYTPVGLPVFAVYDLRAHGLLAVDPSTTRGLAAGIHGSSFVSPPGGSPFVAVQVLRSLDGRVVLGDEGVIR